MRCTVMLLVGLALVGCKDGGGSDSGGELEAGDVRDATVQPGADAAVNGTTGVASGDASSTDAATAADASPGTAQGDASSQLPDASSQPDGSAPDGAVATFVPCTSTKDVTVNVPSGNSKCAFVLAGAPTAPSYLTVKMDGFGLYQRMADGFYYEQGKLVLDGAACDQVSDKQPHVIEVSLFCN